MSRKKVDPAAIAAVEAELQKSTSDIAGLLAAQKSLRHSCAKLVVADPASAIKTHLLEQMWRHGVHVAIDRLRRAGPAAATAAQRLQVLEPAKTDYRTLAKAIQDRLPSKLSPDLARVDVKDVRLKGTSHRANVREQHKDRLTCSFLLCYHHCHLALGDIARYMAEAQQALEASEHTLTGSASAESDALHRLDRLCRLHYEVAARIDPRAGTVYNRLAHLSMRRHEALDVVFYFGRALAARHPAFTARESLMDFLEKNKIHERGVNLAQSLVREPDQPDDSPADIVDDIPSARAASKKSTGPQTAAPGELWVAPEADDSHISSLWQQLHSVAMAQKREEEQQQAASAGAGQRYQFATQNTDDSVLDQLFMASIAPLFLGIASKDLEMVQLAFEAVLLDRLGRAALDSDKCIKYAATLIMLVQRAISSATDGVPDEKNAVAIRCCIVVLRYFWIILQSPLTRAFHMFAGLPAASLLLCWLNAHPALCHAALAAQPDFYDLPESRWHQRPLQFASQLQSALAEALEALRTAVGAGTGRLALDPSGRTVPLHGTSSEETPEDADDDLDQLLVVAARSRIRHTSGHEAESDDSESTADENDQENSSGAATPTPADVGESQQTQPAASDGVELKAELRASAQWLSRRGPEVPLSIDVMLLGASWTPKRLTKLLGVGRSKKAAGGPETSSATAVLWTWRFLVVALDSGWLGVSYKGHQFVMVGELAPAADTQSPNDEHPPSLALDQDSPAAWDEARLSMEVPAAASALGAGRGDLAEREDAELLELRRRKQDLAEELERRQAVSQAAAAQKARAQRVGGDAMASPAPAAVQIVQPQVLVPDTNVLVNAKMTDFVQGIVTGKLGANLALAIPMMVLQELQGLAKGESEGGEQREAGVAGRAKAALAFLEKEFAAGHGRLYTLSSHGDYVHGMAPMAEVGVRQRPMSSDDVIVQAAMLHAKDCDTSQTIEGQVRTVKRLVLLSGDKNMRLKARSQQLPSCNVETFAEWLRQKT